MPSSRPNSSDSQPPSATPSADGVATLPKVEWRTNALLFLATVASVFATFLANSDAPFGPKALLEGAQFTGALLTILLVHEFGHYIAARIHKVDATLPFFIPLPILSPWGTMGAVIRMRGVIPTRRALLDIGAAGPLAGLALAVPLYIWGVSHSQMIDVEPGKMMQLGESLVTRLIDHTVLPPIPEGKDIVYSPIAWAAWAGMFVTMINLLPVGQLDAGHVAYALIGPRQNKVAVFVHRAVLAFFFVSLGSFVLRDVRAGLGLVRIGTHVTNSLFWLVWFEILAVLGSVAQRGTPRESDEAETTGERLLTPATRLVATLGLALVAGFIREKGSNMLWIAWFASLAVLLAMEVKWGALRPHTLLDHPPTGPEPLGIGRKIVAVITLVFFALLFMPTPIAM